MSTPPPSLSAISAAYRCGHCASDPPNLVQDEHGAWHLSIPHDDGCPVLTGQLSALPDALRAFTTAGR